MLYHSRVSIIILTFFGAEERSKETLSLISLAQRKKEKKLISSQPSNLPCPKEDFEPLPDPRQSLARTQHRKSQRPTISFRFGKPGHGLYF